MESTELNKKQIKFSFGIHNHQPVGNFGWVFEDCFNKSYLPFLDVLSDFPSIRIAVHTSGPLLEWIEGNCPEYIDKLAALVAIHQVEILGGGFYEPILSIVPYSDALDQIEMMNRWVRDRLGTEIRGIWLAERIWEPNLPHLLSEAGIQYAICDTTHFQWAGLPVESIKGYYVTERLGDKVSVFPIDRKLRYTIPFRDPEETVRLLLDLAETDPGRVITYADDGEKFGVWPGTYNLVYEREWLRRFFTLLCEHEDQIVFTPFGEVLDSVAPIGRVMLPVASYLEMTQWALPAKAGHDLSALTENLKNGNDWERFEPFMRGGFWDNFLVKYPESNWIHKRMLRVSSKVARIADPEIRNQAKLPLFRGQCNCAYWHGLFGGLYLNYLRDALTRNLLQAERIADRTLHEGELLGLDIEDFDCDGFDEAILENDHFNAVVSSGAGASCSIVDLREFEHTVTNVLTRRPESYHEQVRTLPDNVQDNTDVVSIHNIRLAKESGLADYLIFDPWDRQNFQDHFFAQDIDLDRFRKMDNLPANDFIQKPFSFVFEERTETQAMVEYERTGVIDSDRSLTVNKRYSLTRGEPRLVAQYTFTAGSQPIDVRWGCEFNLTLLAKDGPDRKLIVGETETSLDQIDVYRSVAGFTLVDHWQKFALAITTDATSDLWTFPIETVNQSEGGFEKTYQGTSFTLLSPLLLKPKQTTTVQIVWKVTKEESS